MFQGSPYNRSDLRAVNVNTADMCILLSPGHGSEEDEHQALSDKEVILVTLNLKGEFHFANLVLDYSATVYRSALGFIIPYRPEKWLLLRRLTARILC